MPSRVESRRLVSATITPVLTGRGFVHRKGNCYWRIADHKSDVVELRFLTLGELRQFGLPESSFSLLYGCYFHFIPELSGGRFLHQIPGLVTPRESICHYRGEAARVIRQSPKNLDSSVWHLEEGVDGVSLVLSDVVRSLESEVLPHLDAFDSVREWIRFLEEDEAGNLGTGARGSPMRLFLLAFSLRFAGSAEPSRQYLLDAQRSYQGLLESLPANRRSAASDLNEILSAIRGALSEAD